MLYKYAFVLTVLVSHIGFTSAEILVPPPPMPTPICSNPSCRDDEKCVEAGQSNYWHARPSYRQYHCVKKLNLTPPPPPPPGPPPPPPPVCSYPKCRYDEECIASAGSSYRQYRCVKVGKPFLPPTGCIPCDALTHCPSSCGWWKTCKTYKGDGCKTCTNQKCVDWWQWW